MQMEIQGTTDCVTNYVNMNVHEMDIPYHTLIIMEVLVVWPSQTQAQARFALWSGYARLYGDIKVTLSMD